MLTLGILLRTIIDNRRINISALSEKLGISRSILYRYISDKVIVPQELLKKLRIELMLTPSEINLLNEAHEAASIGMDKYQCRKIVKDIVTNPMPAFGKIIDFDAEEYNKFLSSLNGKNTHAILGAEKIGYALRYIFNEAMKNQESIYLFAQPDNELIMNEIMRFLNTDGNQARLFHIYRLCQSETLEVSTPLLFNMNLQKNLLYTGHSIKKKIYYPSYFYDHAVSQSRSPILQPIRLTTKSASLFVFENNQKAILIQDNEIANLYNNELKLLHGSLAPFITMSSCSERISELSKRRLYSCPELTISGEPSAFFARARLFDRVRTLQDKKTAASIKKLIEKNDEAIKDGLPVQSYFTLDGLNSFIRAESLSCDPMGKLRKDLIRDYLEIICQYAMRYENVSVHLMTENVPKTFLFYNLFIYEDLEIWQTSKGDTNRVYTLCEKSTVQALSDYFFNVFPSTVKILGKNETVEILESKTAEI